MPMNTFTTSDYQIAAFCMCKGARLVRIDRTSRRAVFIFEGEQDLNDYSHRFWSNESVPVEDFVTAQSHIKKRLFSDSF